MSTCFLFIFTMSLSGLFEGSIIYGRKFPVLPVFDFHLCSSGNNLLPARIIFGTCNLISFIVIRNFPVGKVKFITIAAFSSSPSFWPKH